MRKVFSKTADVAAAWAAQEQDEARTGSNTSFRGDTLRSYGTPIARIVRAADDTRRVALISSEKWSSGTSKVQGEADDAAKRHEYSRYRVARLCKADDVAAVVANLLDMRDQIVAMIEGIRRAVRADTARNWRAQAFVVIDLAERYAVDMGITWRWDGPSPDTVINPKETAR